MDRSEIVRQPDFRTLLLVIIFAGSFRSNAAKENAPAQSKAELTDYSKVFERQVVRFSGMLW
jgi:hypothetical protein